MLELGANAYMHVNACAEIYTCTKGKKTERLHYIIRCSDTKRKRLRKRKGGRSSDRENNIKTRGKF